MLKKHTVAQWIKESRLERFICQLIVYSCWHRPCTQVQMGKGTEPPIQSLEPFALITKRWNGKHKTAPCKAERNRNMPVWRLGRPACNFPIRSIIFGHTCMDQHGVRPEITGRVAILVRYRYESYCPPFLICISRRLEPQKWNRYNNSVLISRRMNGADSSHPS